MSVSQTPSAPPPTFYDVQEVAVMFKMSRMTVYRAIRAGELPAVRIRGRWTVPASVIQALIAQAEAALADRPNPAPWEPFEQASCSATRGAARPITEHVQRGR